MIFFKKSKIFCLSFDEKGNQQLKKTPTISEFRANFFDSKGELCEIRQRSVYIVPSDTDNIFIHMYATKKSTVRIAVLQFVKTVYMEKSKRLRLPINVTSLNLDRPQILRVEINKKTKNYHYEFVLLNEHTLL